MVAAAIRQAFLQAEAAAAHQTWRHVADQLRPRWPKLAALMDDSEHDVLAYMAFPAQHRAKLHSTDEIDKPRPGLVDTRSKACGSSERAEICHGYSPLAAHSDARRCAPTARRAQPPWSVSHARSFSLPGCRSTGQCSAGTRFKDESSFWV
jgi:transposase-like protein